MRLLWLRRTEGSRPWHSLPDERDSVVDAMFHASTYMELGDGRKALFWEDRWLQGKSIAEIAPCLYASVGSQVKKVRIVDQSLIGDSWTRDIAGALTVQVILDYLLIWDMTGGVQLLMIEQTVCAGNGLQTRPSPQPQLIRHSSLGSTLWRVRGYFAKRVHHPNVNSSYGWCCTTGVGRPPGGGGTGCMMMILAPSANNHKRPSITC